VQCERFALDKLSDQFDRYIASLVVDAFNIWRFRIEPFNGGRGLQSTSQLNTDARKHFIRQRKANRNSLLTMVMIEQLIDDAIANAFKREALADDRRAYCQSFSALLSQTRHDKPSLDNPQS
jgi:hypothetical protein